MKKILTLIAISLTSITGFSQVASRILSTQSVPQPISAPNFLWVDNSAGAMNRLWVASADSLKIQPFQLTWFNDSVINKTSSLYKPLNWFPTWTEVTGRPNFSTVATTGQYNDLLGKPTLFSGNYNDLTNKPTIPAAQVNTDWNSSSGVSQLLNKPLLGTAAFTNSADYATAAQGSLAATAVQPGTLTSTLSNYVTNTSLSTTLGNYVTASSLTSTLGGYATTTALSSGLTGKENTITAGTTSQYWRGDKTWQTLNTTVVPEGTNLYYTDARARASNSAGTGISYNSTTGVITNSAPDQTVTLTAGTGISVIGTYPNFTVGSTVTVPTINNNVSRTLNSNYTISTTRLTTVHYTINLTVTNPLLVGTSTATVFLEYSLDGGTTWNLVSQASNSSGVGITVTIAIQSTQGSVLAGVIPANALSRIRTTTSGTASVTYITGQEVLN